MGTEDLFRRHQNPKFERRNGKRKPYDRVLIVCEGKKTEPYYLEALKDYLKLSQASIEIVPSPKSNPTSIVSYTEKRIGENKSDPYDRVFCVIDKDTHKDFDKAIIRVRNYNNKKTKLDIIVSNPCFEYWILLHYEYIAKSFGANGGSPCEDLIKNHLKKHKKDYQKGDKNFTRLIVSKFETAINNAKKANQNAETSNTDHPTTQMDRLVEYLRDLKK